MFAQYRGLKKENHILFFGRMMTNAGSMIWPMLTLILNQKMGMSASQVAMIMVIAGLVVIPASLLGGKLADRCNKKMLIVYGDLISVSLFIIAGLIPLSMITVVLVIFAAAAQSMEDPPYLALIADINPTERREDAYSLNYLGANIGLVLSPTIAGILFRNYLWLSFIISGAALGCSTLLIFFRLKDIRPVRETSEAAQYQKEREGIGLWTVLKENPVILLFLAAAGLYAVCYDQFGFLMPLEMGQVHGAQGAVIFGTVTSLNCIVVVIFTPLITAWTHRIESPLRMLFGTVFQFLGLLLFALFLGHVPVYYAAMVLFTWGEVFMTISTGPYMSKRIPASHRGRLNGVYMVIAALAAVFGQLLFGHIYDAAGSLRAWRAVRAVGVAASVLCVCLICADRVRYRKLYEKDRPDRVRPDWDIPAAEAAAGEGTLGTEMENERIRK